jgi:hypothetical protein
VQHRAHRAFPDLRPQRPGRLEAEERRRHVRRGGKHRPDANDIDRDLQLLRDELVSVEGSVAEQRVEPEVAPDVADVGIVVAHLADEDLLAVESDQLRALHAGSLGEQHVDVLAVDFAGAVEGQGGDAEALEPLEVAGTGIPADVVSLLAQMHRDRRQRGAVSVERHRGEQDLHDAAPGRCVRGVFR